MITVAEYARKEGVSVQTIYRRINKLDTENLTVKKGGILYITDDGIAALAPVFEDVEQVKHPEVPGDKAREYNDVLIPFLREQCEFLREELSREREYSRSQAVRLSELSEQMAELVRNNQILIVAEQNRNNMALLSMEDYGVKQNAIEDVEPAQKTPQKRGFFARLFNSEV
jgi:hypothetical protein